MPSSSPEHHPPSASEVLLGTALSHIERLDFNWVFHFGDAVRLSVEAPWRVLSRNSILVTSEDDGQKFGLTTPVDASATLRQILENRRVSSVEVDTASSDLRIQFDNERFLR